MSILVTGASGFVGSGVIPHLLSRGYRVRALVRKRSGQLQAGTSPSGRKASALDHPHLTRVIGDMRDRASLQAAMDGVDWVIHLAAAIADEPESEAINVGGARNLAEACLHAGVPENNCNDSRCSGTQACQHAGVPENNCNDSRCSGTQACSKSGVKVLINVSTQSAKLKRKGLYGRTKDEADRILHAAGIPVVTLRCSIIYGNLHGGIFGSLLQFTRLPVVPIIGSGEAIFRPIHRDDLAEIITRCALEPSTYGRVFDVGGPDAVSFNELVDEMLRRCHRRRPKLHIPSAVAMVLATLCSFLPHPPITRSNVLGAGEILSMQHEELWKEIGFVPRTLSSGLDALFAREREQEREEEARALLSYVMSGWSPSAAHIRRVLQASEKLSMQDGHRLDPIVCRFPILLGALDAITRLRSPDCTLQKKMLIAAAVVECSPESAEWLLPKERSVATLVLQIFGIALVALARLCIGIPLLAFPSFCKRNAGC